VDSAGRGSSSCRSAPALANLLYGFDWGLPEGVASEDVSMEEAGGLTVHKKTPLLLVPTRYKRQR
jgi:4-hydroxyphenylacetaldehyde oxime monooxygenase